MLGSIAPTTAALGLAVRELRDLLGMTQEELAQAAGMHTTYLSGIEGGRRNPTWRILGRLCDGLGVRMSELVARAERLDGAEQPLPARRPR